MRLGEGGCVPISSFWYIWPRGGPAGIRLGACKGVGCKANPRGAWLKAVCGAGLDACGALAAGQALRPTP